MVFSYILLSNLACVSYYPHMCYVYHKPHPYQSANPHAHVLHGKGHGSWNS